MYPIFTEALFIIARTWEQPRSPSTDKWIKKLLYIYTMEYYSAIEWNTFESVLMRWMNLEPIMQSEVSQKQKDKYHILLYIYGIQKNGTEEFIYRAAMEKQTQRIDLWTRGEGELYSKFLMAIYFTYDTVSFHLTLCIHLTLSSPLPIFISLFFMSVSPLLP